MNELINPFISSDGALINSIFEWENQRSYYKEILTNILYGSVPSYDNQQLRYRILDSSFLYDGKAIKDHVALYLFNDDLPLEINIIRPAIEEKVPVIVWGIGFFRGNFEKCPIEYEVVCNRHFALATYNREQFAPDGPGECTLTKRYPGYSWGRIAQWAFLGSRVADYLETTGYLMKGGLIVTGHSRGGKTSICTGIYDERFSIVHANGSGCCGFGALEITGSRYGIGTGNCETIPEIYKSFPYWWCSDLSKYAETGKSLPVDAHIMRALIAPRIVISTEGDGDTWSNPYGTLVAWRAAQEVFDFVGASENNGIHYREGGHQFGPSDWKALIDFADYHLRDTGNAGEVVYFEKNWIENSDRFDWRNIKLHYSWGKNER